jgi:hypothetical protein
MAKKTTRNEIADMLLHVVKSVGRIEENMIIKKDHERDLAAVEKRLADRSLGVKVKVEGVQKTLEAEALQRTDLQLPRRVRSLKKR